MSFPTQRPRRLRRNENLRRMVRETHLRVDDLIMPLFIVPGSGVENPIGSMPGISQLSVDRAVEECKSIRDLGVPVGPITAATAQEYGLTVTIQPHDYTIPAFSEAIVEYYQK